MQLFDTHAHLTHEDFGSELPDVLARARDRGVEAVCAIASDLDDARAALGLVRESSVPNIFTTAGIHPHEADRCTPEALGDLEELARSAGAVVAIGETGLDFHYENAPRAAQLDAFRGQIEIAERLGLPLVVHSRDASEEVARLVREYAGRVIGVLHCLTGGSELLRAGLEAGWYISFSGIVTYKSFRDTEHVRRVPSDRLLVETDSPYLAPVPVRGRRNEPSFVAHVVRRVAEIRGEDADRTAESTYRNACRLFGIAPPA